MEDPNYDTIAGFMMGKLNRIPHLHDVVENGNVQIRVKEMDGMRIARLSLKRIEPGAHSARDKEEHKVPQSS